MSSAITCACVEVAGLPPDRMGHRAPPAPRSPSRGRRSYSRGIRRRCRLRRRRTHNSCLRSTVWRRRYRRRSRISAFALMRLVSALAGGRLVDRFGERMILALGIGIVAVSSLLAGLAQNYTRLLVLRGIGGVGSAMFTVSAYAAPSRRRAGATRSRKRHVQAGFLVGGVTGPFIGGVLTSISIRAPFFVYTGTLAVARVHRHRVPLARSPRFRRRAEQRRRSATDWSCCGASQQRVPCRTVHQLCRWLDTVWCSKFADSALRHRRSPP